MTASRKRDWEYSITHEVQMPDRTKFWVKVGATQDGGTFAELQEAVLEQVPAAITKTAVQAEEMSKKW